MNINAKCLNEYISKEHSAAIHRYSNCYDSFILEDIYIYTFVICYCTSLLLFQFKLEKKIYIFISGDKMEGIGCGGLGALA